jgi:KaiC/GvpD/RAD55 family RecA-like ATPase
MNVIWGPPGTGKTTVTVDAIAQLVRERHSVLLVSNTNVAVDNAVQAAATGNWRVAAASAPATGTPPRRWPPELSKHSTGD